MIRMRRITAILLSLLVAAGAYSTLCGSLGCEGDTAGVQLVEFPEIAGPTGNPVFEMAIDLPDMPSKMTIYKVKHPDITPDAVAAIGMKLGLDGEITTSPLGDRYTLCDEVRCLWVWRESGGVNYLRKDVTLYPLEPPELPSKEEAKQIAIDFLDKMGLSPRGAAAIRHTIGRVEMRYAGRSSTGEDVNESYVCQWLVMFDCEIDGVPLCGATTTVGIGNDGEVVQMRIVQGELEPYKQIPIKSAEQAFKELSQGKGSHVANFNCRKVTLNQVYLAYWMEDIMDKQDYVVPVYVFLGESLDQDGETQDFRGYCNAL
ncbi:hypothetical protein ES703_79838 [subsurface metagenome]